MERENVLGNHDSLEYSRNAVFWLQYFLSINFLVSGLVMGHYEMHCSQPLSWARTGCLVNVIKSFLNNRGYWQDLQSLPSWPVVIFRTLIICLSRYLIFVVSSSHGNSSVCMCMCVHVCTRTHARVCVHTRTCVLRVKAAWGDSYPHLTGEKAWTQHESSLGTIELDHGRARIEMTFAETM